VDSSNLIEEHYLKSSDGMTREDLEKNAVVDDAYLDDFLMSKPFPQTTQSKDGKGMFKRVPTAEKFNSPCALLDQLLAS
jgi:hypothetical protein